MRTNLIHILIRNVFENTGKVRHWDGLRVAVVQTAQNIGVDEGLSLRKKLRVEFDQASIATVT